MRLEPKPRARTRLFGRSVRRAPAGSAPRRFGRPLTADLAVAAAVTAVVVAGSIAVDVHGAEHAARHLDAVGYLLLVASGAALAWRRRAPTTVLLSVFALVSWYDLAHFPGGPAYLPLIVAFATTIVVGDRRVGYAVLAAGYLISIRPLVDPIDPGSALGLAAWLLLLAAGAEIARIRARARAAEELQAARAAQARTERARRRAGEQRLRIARDLHDVLAHQLALISVQANAALALREREPDRADHALRAIREVSNTALAELHHVLDVLRTPDEQPPRQPVPLLSRRGDVEPLLDGARRAGLHVRDEIGRLDRPLPVAVDQAGYRILQEALTNAVRHAGPGAAVRVRVDYRLAAAHLVVCDDGRGVPAGSRGGGNGLPGMRERVTALGGTLHARARPDGGFRVEATLPLGATA